MPRDLARLSVARYDLLVVGGGIHGLFIALDASTRGLRVALVEQGDVGGVPSFCRDRTIHGGMWALWNGHLATARREMRERRTWARMAPHLVRPLPFLLGTYRFTRHSRLALKTGFAAYNAMSRSRNAGVPSELHLPRPKLESPTTTRHLFPGVAPHGLTGGAAWYDYQTRHPDRLSRAIAVAATRAGAHLATHVGALRPLKSQQRVAGMRVTDRLTGQEYDVEAAATLLAAGSALGDLMALCGAQGAAPLMRTIGLLFDRPARDIATVARGASGRMLIAVPWHGYVAVNTQHPVAGQHTGALASIDDAIADVNAAFPAMDVGRNDLRMSYRGMTPVAADSRIAVSPRATLIRHRNNGVPGLLSLSGGALTTARYSAELAVDAVCREIGRPRGRSLTATSTLPHADIADVEGRLEETSRTLGVTLDRDVRDYLSSWYSTEAAAVLEFCASRNLFERVTADSPVLLGEIAYAAECADAFQLADAVLRRTPLGSTGHPGRPALSRAAGIMARTCGWSEEEQARQVSAVECLYPPIAR